MKKFLLIITGVFFTFTAIANYAEMWDEANRLYSEKQYRDAVAKYEEILANEGFSAELHYNLGNAYYRINEIGFAILHYERALRLKPFYADAIHNLEFVNQKVVDSIEPANHFFLKKWTDLLLKLMSPNGWFMFSVPFFIVALICFLIFIFGRSRIIRKSGFYFGAVFMIVSFLTLSFSAIKINRLKNQNEGIIMTGAVVIKGSPDRSGTDLFQLHEGTKVAITSSLGDWYEIKLSNGNVGWIQKQNIEII